MAKRKSGIKGELNNKAGRQLERERGPGGEFQEGFLLTAARGQGPDLIEDSLRRPIGVAGLPYPMADFNAAEDERVNGALTLPRASGGTDIAAGLWRIVEALETGRGSTKNPLVFYIDGTDDAGKTPRGLPVPSMMTAFIKNAPPGDKAVQAARPFGDITYSRRGDSTTLVLSDAHIEDRIAQLRQKRDKPKV